MFTPPGINTYLYLARMFAPVPLISEDVKVVPSVLCNVKRTSLLLSKNTG